MANPLARLGELSIEELRERYQVALRDLEATVLAKLRSKTAVAPGPGQSMPSRVAAPPCMPPRPGIPATPGVPDPAAVTPGPPPAAGWPVTVHPPRKRPRGKLIVTALACATAVTVLALVYGWWVGAPVAWPPSWLLP